MNESACLLRSFSHPSQEAKERDPLSALGESISFGRFMSESLAWEKWSAFSHNRILEEVEKFSKPGSVAQKKAYFEAHYKRKAAQKAAAELEGASSEVINEVETEDNSCTSSCHDSELLRAEKQVTETGEQQDSVQNAEFVASTDTETHYSLNEENMVEIAEVEEKITEVEEKMTEVEEKITDHNDPVETSASTDNGNQSENVDDHTKAVVSEDPKPPDDASPAAEREITAPGSLKRLRNFCSSRLLTGGRSSKPPSSPAKLATSIQQTICKSNVTPKSKKQAGDIAKRITKSVHMSINFNSRPPSSPAKQATSIQQPICKSNVNPKSKKFAGDIAERMATKSVHMSINFKSCPIVGKTSSELPQIGRNMTHVISVGVSKETPPPQKISNRASVNGLLKHPVMKPPSEIRRSFKSSTTSGNEERSPIICSPFRFRSEERAAKRKEFFQKLEEKANFKETGQKQLQERCQEKMENDIINVRQNRSFKAKENQDPNQGLKSPSNHIKKISIIRPRSPQLGKKPANSMASLQLGKKPATGMVKDTGSLPPRRPVTSDNSKCIIRKKNQGMGQSVTSLGKKMNAGENSSPNIQRVD